MFDFLILPILITLAFLPYTYPLFVVLLLIQYRQRMKWWHYLSILLVPLQIIYAVTFVDEGLWNDDDVNPLFWLALLVWFITGILPLVYWIFFRYIKPQVKPAKQAKRKIAKK